jgi:uncharacterized protein YdeI (YjbR/CyaY-like superfamily)
MKPINEDLPIMAFKDGMELRNWLDNNHQKSEGIWVRIYKKNSGIKSVAFEDVLDEGLCFGWSESLRRKGDMESYLQRFTPRRTKGTTSKRNQEHIKVLIKGKKMTPAGLAAADL